MADKRPFAAHINEDGTVQTIREHAEGTADLASRFAAPFGAAALARQCALAHDIGKYSAGFQRRIWDNGPKVDHSTAGAREIGRFSTLAAYCVAGHHIGLPDGGGRQDGGEAGTFFGRVLRKPLPDYSAYQTEIPLEKALPPQLHKLGRQGFSASFFIRMLFSCLVDADYLDTERFMGGGKARPKNACGIDTLVRMLDEHIAKRHWTEAAEGLNGKRSAILKACLQAGDTAEKGLFTLTVPTGGGKTVSSLAFALHHAQEQRMERVIYVIPYCSVIEQTADVFSGILGAGNVLAHYSGASYDDEHEDAEMSLQCLADGGRNMQGTPDKRREKALKRLAAENWDMPVVVTTAVQFFESLFSNRPSACRKLHNIANSVVVFDEAQTLPLPYLKPCVNAIAELAVNYGASCVLCTATQPALGSFFSAYAPDLTATEICPDTRVLYRAFRRVRYEQLGTLSDEELARRLNACAQALCIVTTRAQAKNVYALLRAEGSYHLSTLMTPAHRRAVLQTVRQRLLDGLPCRVVSTSLIEAGVDVDFPTVYRAYAGLDSEIQAGGRCNRENRRPLDQSVVCLFEPESRYHRLAALKRPTAEARSAARGKAEIDAPETVAEYFERLYADSGDAVDLKDIAGRFERGAENAASFPFKSAAEDFCIIENNTRAVLVPRDARSREIDALLVRPGFRPGIELYREMGQYCVNVYENHFRELMPSLRIVDEHLAVLAVPNLYDENTGLSFSNDGGYALME